MQTLRHRLFEKLAAKKYFFVFCGILALVCLGIALAALPLARRFAGH